ncbi:MAG: hypothetical protein P1U74_01760 [Legionellaceae bacterium]|nr:hypothetical protein [Legionellaceae bacterium]
MNVFLYSTLSFSVAWFIHLIIWRSARPAKHTRALLIIFLSVLCATLIVSKTSTSPLTWVEALQVIVFYISTMLAYICFYSSIEEDSPSIELIKYTESKKTCEMEDYLAVINNQMLVDSRLQAIVRDGLLFQKDNQYGLTSQGFRLGKLFYSSYIFLQLKDGG